MKNTKIILTVVGVIVAIGGIIATFKLTKIGDFFKCREYIKSSEYDY